MGGLLRAGGRRFSSVDDMGVVGTELFGNGSARIGSAAGIGSSILGFGGRGGTIQWSDDGMEADLACSPIFLVISSRRRRVRS